MRLIDAHIHLDCYKDHEIRQIIGLNDIKAFISVSSNMDSCKRNLKLSGEYSKVKPAFGFHPEQHLPDEDEISNLINWIEENQSKMIAIGEVGLPYYLRKAQKVTSKQFDQYIEMLETFVILAKKWDKPIILHAVYEDAPLVCDLLEKHSIVKAHFHWFKGDRKTTDRLIDNGYFISITPDVVYKEKTQQLALNYPLKKMMVETDGPWPFEGPFYGKRTTPLMMRESITMLGKLKKLSEVETAKIVVENTKEFYNL